MHWAASASIARTDTICACVCTYIYIYIYVITYVYLYLYIYIYIYIEREIYISCIHIYIYIYIYIYMYIYIYIYIYIERERDTYRHMLYYYIPTHPLARTSCCAFLSSSWKRSGVSCYSFLETFRRSIRRRRCCGGLWQHERSCGLDPGNLKFETVQTNKQHICFWDLRRSI